VKTLTPWSVQELHYLCGIVQSAIATFLKDSTTALPADYFKQADSVLRDETGNPLTNENGMVLTGRV